MKVYIHLKLTINFYSLNVCVIILPVGEFEARIFKACPNIQELHLGVSLDTDKSIKFFSKLHLEHLTTLTLESVSLPYGEVLGQKV